MAETPTTFGNIPYVPVQMGDAFKALQNDVPVLTSVFRIEGDIDFPNDAYLEPVRIHSENTIEMTPSVKKGPKALLWLVSTSFNDREGNPVPDIAEATLEQAREDMEIMCNPEAHPEAFFKLALMARKIVAEVVE